MTSELRRIALAARLLAARTTPGVSVAIGDDAAVLSASPPWVWTVDSSVEGVHFDRRWLGWADVGARALHAAASDVVAMAGKPVAALSSLVLPAAFHDRDLAALLRGQARAARELGCPVVGGNFARGGEVSLTTTVLGRAARPLTRRGARPGDELWLVGDVGLAGAGLRLLERGASRGRGVARCVAAWRRPRALLREGPRLAGRAHALMDVSDGLARDADGLARASGVAVVIELADLERALATELHHVAALLGQSALELALSGGEDYALLAAGPAGRRPRGALAIGRIERGEGLWLDDGARLRRSASRGWDHFSGKKPAYRRP